MMKWDIGNSIGVLGSGAPQLIQYIVLSEFDIDHGSTVRLQYPSDVPYVTADWLAEHMIPEGVHAREMDVTYMVLNRSGISYVDYSSSSSSSSSSSLSSSKKAAGATSVTSDSGTTETESGISVSASGTDSTDNDNDNEKNKDSPPSASTDKTDIGVGTGKGTDADGDYILYGINIVCCKNDANVRRGAVVKALSVFSLYPFVESLKYTLFSVLEQYYQLQNQAAAASITTGIDTGMGVDAVTASSSSSSGSGSSAGHTFLKTFFLGLNAADIPQGMPRMSSLERHLLLRTSVDVSEYARLAEEQSKKKSRNRNSDNDRNGKAEETNANADSLPCVLQDWHHTTTFQLPAPHSSFTGKVSIPLYFGSNQIGDVNLSRFVTTFREQSLRVYSAILAHQRVMFVGHAHAARDVAQMVLSAVAMLSSVLPDVIHRAYPYVTLSDLSFLDCEGFIAGCTNPMFSQKQSWCDVLCVLDMSNDTGSVIEHVPLGCLVESKGGSGSGSGSIIASSSSSSSVSVSHSLPFREQNRDGEKAESSSNSNNNRTRTFSSGGAGTGNATNEIEVSPAVHTSTDKAFMLELLSEIEIEEISEDIVRLRFLDFTMLIVLQAQDLYSLLSSDRLVDEERAAIHARSYRAQLLRNYPPSKGRRNESEWMHVQSCPLALALALSQAQNNAMISSSILTSAVQASHHIRRLHCEEGLHWTELELVYSELDDFLTAENNIQALVSVFPKSHIDVIALGMLSVSPNVRMCAHNILSRMNEYPSTQRIFMCLDSQLLRTFHRLCNKKANGALQQELHAWRGLANLAEADLRSRKSVSYDDSVILDLL